LRRGTESRIGRYLLIVKWLVAGISATGRSDADDALRHDRGRDTTMQYGVEEGAKSGFARVDELLQRLPLDA